MKIPRFDQFVLGSLLPAVLAGAAIAVVVTDTFIYPARISGFPRVVEIRQVHDARASFAAFSLLALAITLHLGMIWLMRNPHSTQLRACFLIALGAVAAGFWGFFIAELRAPS